MVCVDSSFEQGCAWLKDGNLGFYFALYYADDHTSICKHTKAIAKHTQAACN